MSGKKAKSSKARRNWFKMNSLEYSRMMYEVGEETARVEKEKQCICPNSFYEVSTQYMFHLLL